MAQSKPWLPPTPSSWASTSAGWARRSSSATRAPSLQPGSRRAARDAGIRCGGAGRLASPLDQFLAHHPEYFFERSPEQALVNPDHLLILLEHLRCAMFELPFQKGEGFGALPGETSTNISSSCFPTTKRTNLSRQVFLDGRPVSRRKYFVTLRLTAGRCPADDHR
jgi:ATP-dependent helicase YprA (DUF1998 family)